jgi:hypothetical protein
MHGHHGGSCGQGKPQTKSPHKTLVHRTLTVKGNIIIILTCGLLPPRVLPTLGLPGEQLQEFCDYVSLLTVAYLTKPFPQAVTVNRA